MVTWPRVLRGVGLVVAVVLAVIRVATWASRIDAHISAESNGVRVEAHAGEASVDFAVHMPRAPEMTEALRGLPRLPPLHSLRPTRSMRRAHRGLSWLGGETSPW